MLVGRRTAEKFNYYSPSYRNMSTNKAGEINNLKPSERELFIEKFHQYTLFDIGVDPGLKDDEGNSLPRPYTKSQMRKWLKKVKWENRKAEKRAREKARAKERRKEAKATNLDIGPSRKTLKKMKFEKQKKNIGVIIDLSFDELMIEKDRYKAIKQILRCYSINRRSETPLQFHITSFEGLTKSDFSRHNGYEHWDVEYHEKPYIEIFLKEKLVYLTSESDNIIESFEEDTYYIIGGLVDHNQHKYNIDQLQRMQKRYMRMCTGASRGTCVSELYHDFQIPTLRKFMKEASRRHFDKGLNHSNDSPVEGLCHKIAMEQGIRHARLPLDKYVDMKTRKVLTIDHVFEIVLRVCEGLPWQEALLMVLPLRKGAHLNDSVSINSDSNILSV